MRIRAKAGLVLFLCFCLTGCIGMPEVLGQSLSSSSSYFDNYTSKSSSSGTKCTVKGTVHQMENTENAILAWIDAKEDTTVTVTGTMERIEGEITLVYTQADGTEILIASGENSALDTIIDIPKGKGRFHFSGSDGDAVYRFDLTFQGHGKMNFGENEEVLPKMDDMPSDIDDNLSNMDDNFR